MKLVLVESPTKTKTLEKILGKEYKVSATLGHVRDLPKKKFGVDLETFDPTYVTIPNKKKVVKELKKQAEKSDEVILAADLDREGEAIAWHTIKALGLEDYKRIVFSEITQSALEKAIENPRKIDDNLINAQQARRILDRIVGYKLSPLLWKKIARGLSAGRVQSVALKLVVEREKERDAFNPQEYWTIHGLFSDKKFEAKLKSIGGENLKKFDIQNEEQAQDWINKIKKNDYKITMIEKKEKKRSPYPPFTTASLQQDAWHKLNSSSKQTSYLAQKLYEKGLITYHRTDSLNIAKEASTLAKKIIEEDLGEEYSKPRTFKTDSKSAQEAHEAIRPSYPDKKPNDLDLSKKQKALYNLIWSRFIASQMSDAVFDRTKVNIEGGRFLFRANGQTLKFDGFTKIYPVSHKSEILPELEEEQDVDLKEIEPEQHFTRPPARYNEASLIKKLKKEGIGRPSTYSPIVSVIQSRNYVEKDDSKRFYPTDLGTMVSDLLTENFPNVFDLGFTAEMEESLDKIAQGEKDWKKILKEFYGPFEKKLEEGYDKIKKKVIKTDKKCPECEEDLLIRMGRYGKFYGCSDFPECKYTKNIVEKIGMDCPDCDGDVIKKRTKKGKIFYGCSNYPDCEYASWDNPKN